MRLVYLEYFKITITNNCESIIEADGEIIGYGSLKVTIFQEAIQFVIN